MAGYLKGSENKETIRLHLLLNWFYIYYATAFIFHIW